MYKIFFNEGEGQYELKELVRMFLPEGAYVLLSEDPWETGEPVIEGGDILLRLPDGMRDKNESKRYLYQELSRLTGQKPDWGTLTGVRPLKLAGELLGKTGSMQGTQEVLKRDYLVHEDKVSLLLKTLQVQREVMEPAPQNSAGVYIGIPFCPTRCLYCSFPSNEASQESIDRYLPALYQEMRFCGQAMKERDIYPETIYVGGGTPTALSAGELAQLLFQINSSFDLSRLREFTVEAGRPDTITEEKVSAILEGGAGRISVNPQSMRRETLERIGRRHGPEDILKAFDLARKAGVPVINCDLIAGLPGETPEDFVYTLDRILSLSPENITVHTLAVKRASKLRQMDETYHFRQGDTVRDMLSRGRALLSQAGYRPYYLYRQKQMTGNFENVGYGLPGTENLYNMRIMEENQTIVALGAGGISKAYYPNESRLERVPNVSNYEIYIHRIDEMLARKKDGLFGGGNLRERDEENEA